MSAEDVVLYRWYARHPKQFRNVLSDGEWNYSEPGEWHPDNAEALVTLTASQARYERLRGMVEGLAAEWEKEADAFSAAPISNEDRGYSNAQYHLAEQLRTLLADGGEANDNEESK